MKLRGLNQIYHIASDVLLDSAYDAVSDIHDNTQRYLCAKTYTDASGFERILPGEKEFYARTVARMVKKKIEGPSQTQTI